MRNELQASQFVMSLEGLKLSPCFCPTCTLNLLCQPAEHSRAPADAITFSGITGDIRCVLT